MREVLYSYSFFEGLELSYFAHKYLERLPKDVTVLLARGSSGCAIASAMIAISPQDRPLRTVIIRKDRESSRGSGFAGRSVDPKDTIAIVDDFTGTGETVRALIEWAVTRGLSVKYLIVHHIWDSEKIQDINVKKIILDNEEE